MRNKNYDKLVNLLAHLQMNQRRIYLALAIVVTSLACVLAGLLQLRAPIAPNRLSGVVGLSLSAAGGLWLTVSLIRENRRLRREGVGRPLGLR